MAIAGNTTEVKRDRALTLKAALAALAFAAGACFSIWKGHDIALGCLLGVLAAGSLLFLKTRGSAACPMPGCGASFQAALGTNREALCRQCGTYFEGEGGRLRQIPEDRVAESPRFWARLWQEEGTLSKHEASIVAQLPPMSGEDRVLEVSWPPGCCVCGGKAERAENATMSALRQGARAMGLRDERVTLAVSGVPHCASHEKGAKLGVEEGRAVIRFRWLGYRNAFRKLNPPPASGPFIGT